MTQPHYLQLQILKKLLFAPSLKFSELKPNDQIENNQLSFHIDKLVEAGYVVKEDKNYKLTQKGKEYANQIDSEKIHVIKQAKISGLACCVRTNEATREYLIYTRLKHPFFGSQGFPSGKVPYGETVIESVKRELLEETGLAGEPKIFKIAHYRVFNPTTKELVEDKFFYMCKIENPTGVLTPNDEGKYEWVSEDKLNDYLTNEFGEGEVKNIIKEMNEFNGVISFSEEDHFAENF